MGVRHASDDAAASTIVHQPLAHMPEVHTLENATWTQLEVRPELFQVTHGAPTRSTWQLLPNDPAREQTIATGEEYRYWHASLIPSSDTTPPTDTITVALSLKLIGWKSPFLDLDADEYHGPVVTLRPAGGLDEGLAIQLRARHPNPHGDGALVAHPDRWFLSLHVIDDADGASSFRCWKPIPQFPADGMADTEIEVPATTWQRIALVAGPGAVMLYVDGEQRLSVELDPGMRGPHFDTGVLSTIGPPLHPTDKSRAEPKFGFYANAYEDVVSANLKVAGVRMWSMALAGDQLADDARRVGSNPAEQESVEISGAESADLEASSVTGVESSWQLVVDPSLFLVEKYQLTFVPAAIGFGRVAKTLALLPGENVTTFVSTTRTEARSSDARESVVDSTSERVQRSFAEDVSTERQRRDRNEQSTSATSRTAYEVSAHASASWGWGSAGVSSTVSGESSKSRSASSVRDQMSSSLQAVTSTSARQANTHRNIEVTAARTEQEAETHVESMERIFENPHESRTMLATFRQINQRYASLLTLVDVEIGYQDFRSGLGGLDEFLRDVLVDKFPRSRKVKSGETPAEVVRDYVLSQYTEELLAMPSPDDVDGVVRLTSRGGDFLQIDSETDADGRPSPSLNRARRTVAALETGAEVTVDGALIAADAHVMRTDNVGAECMLGNTEIFDPIERATRDAHLRQLQMSGDLSEERLMTVRQIRKALSDAEFSDRGVDVLGDLLVSGTGPDVD
jgi:hypothetical protein